jgi:predicted transcriptional regulator
MMLHNAQSPASKAGHESAREKNMKRNGHVLRENDVILLKRRLLSKKTRVKILAKRFNVSETTIYRIARNENWGHVSAY